ncbi:CapA family protein [Patulibacter defluvii]|uniref:CapA family protein n=1 Tax=Patulibacter defluvii TaxID=3095358 RepID=UPI002A75FFA4|nr:CapA family protein [Patulibacter sp. DM4]
MAPPRPRPRRPAPDPRRARRDAAARRRAAVRRRSAIAILLLAAVVLALRAASQGDPGAPGAVAGARAAAPKRPAPPIEIAWVGDTTLGSSRGLPPANASTMLAGVQGQLGGDLVLGNLEGTFGTGGATKCPATTKSATCFAFQAPPQNAAALRAAGFDLVSLANNHAWDAGGAGMAQTTRALDAAGVRYNGRPGEITLLRTRGRTVAVVGFAAYPWASPINDPAAIRSFVGEAAAKADTVVVTFHAGAEGAGAQRTPAGMETAYGEQRGDVRAFARTAIDAGADLVLGAGPHVLRGMEVYRDRLIAYSLGNFAGYDNFSVHGPMALSGILRVRLAPDGRAIGGRLVPLRLVGKGLPEPDPARIAIDRVASLSAADFGAAAVPIDPEGRLLGDARGHVDPTTTVDPPAATTSGSPAR